SILGKLLDHAQGWRGGGRPLRQAQEVNGGVQFSPAPPQPRDGRGGLTFPPGITRKAARFPERHVDSEGYTPRHSKLTTLDVATGSLDQKRQARLRGHVCALTHGSLHRSNGTSFIPNEDLR